MSMASLSRGSPGASVLPYTARTGAISSSSSRMSSSADVARVEDQLDARERRVHVRPQQSMRVGDQADDALAAVAHSRPAAPQRVTSLCATPR